MNPVRTIRGSTPAAITATVATATLTILTALPGCGEGSSPGPLNLTHAFGEPGTNPGQFSYPRGITAVGDELIIVDKAARVQRVDPETGLASAWFRMPEFDLGKPTGLTIGPHPFAEDRAALYIADTHYYRVSVYELPTEMGVTPTLITQFGELGDGPGQFVYPTDIAILTDDAGLVTRLYISEYGGNDRVTAYDLTTRDDGTKAFTFAFSFGTYGSGPGVEFNRPQSLALDTDRNELIVVDACNHRIGRFTPEGELVAWIGSPTIEAIDGNPTVLDYPYGLEVLDDGTYLACEYGGNRVVQIDPDRNRILRTFGEPGREPGQLASPWGLALGGNDGREAFVLDSRNNRVQAFRSPAPRQEMPPSPGPAVHASMIHDAAGDDHAETHPGGGAG